MHLIVLLIAILLAGCSVNPVPSVPGSAAEAEEPGYAAEVRELAKLNRSAEEFLKARKLDDAAAAITKGQPLATQLLAVPRPTLAAMEAASDMENLYGKMLLANKHYGWARMLFQKNQARWTHWRPQTGESDRRRKLAEDAIAECDRGIAKEGR